MDEMDLLQRLSVIVAVVTAVRSVTAAPVALAGIVDAEELVNKRDDEDYDDDDEETSLVDVDDDHKSKRAKPRRPTLSTCH